MARLSAVWEGRVSPRPVSGSGVVCGPGGSLLAWAAVGKACTAHGCAWVCFMWVWGGAAGKAGVEALRLSCGTRHCLSFPGGGKGVDPAVPGRAGPQASSPWGAFVCYCRPSTLCFLQSGCECVQRVFIKALLCLTKETSRDGMCG